MPAAEPVLLRWWLVLFAVALVPFLLLAWYNYPSIHDDYADSNLVLKLGRVGYIQYVYTHWSGRYTELALKAYLAPLTYEHPEWLSRLQPAAILLLWIAGSYAIFSVILRGIRKSVVLGCALLLTVMYLNGSEGVGAVLYWFGGYTSYTVGAITSLFAFAGMIGLHRYYRRFGAQLLCLLGASFFSVLAIGAYEVSMVAICWVSGTALVMTWLRRHPSRWWFVLLFLVVLAAAYVAASAPGNHVRAMGRGRDISQIMLSPQGVVVGLKSLYFAFTQAISWANQLLLLLGSVLLAGALARLRLELQFALTSVHPGLLAAWLLAGITAMVFPSTLVYQTVWLHSWQCVYFYFVLGWVWLLAALLVRYSSHLALLASLNAVKGRRMIAAAFFVVCFGSNSANTHLAYLDLATGKAHDYNKRVRQREQDVARAATRRLKVAELRPLYQEEETYKIAKVLYTDEFNQPDALDYGQYYGLDSVVVTPSPYKP